MQQQGKEPAAGAPDEEEDEDCSQLQSWNEELTQRLNAAVRQLQPGLARPSKRFRAKQSRQQNHAAVS